MANKKHLEILKKGVDCWNRWRNENPAIIPDLNKAFLTHLKLDNIDLSKADLSFADLCDVELNNGNLTEANLHNVNFLGARLKNTNFNNAKAQYSYFHIAHLDNSTFIDAALYNTNFGEACLFNVDFTGSDLCYANFVGAYLVGANLTNCRVFGVSAWDVNLKDAIQENLIITPDSYYPTLDPTESYGIITVDNLEVAQFIFMMLHNNNLRTIIDTIVSKVVLILGRFTEDRKKVLDLIKNGLRQKNYLPVIFDFSGPISRDISETVSTLAHLSRFVVADITDAKSIPQELQIIIPNLPSLPIQPIIRNSEIEYSLFEHYKKYPWVLKTINYNEHKPEAIIDEIVANCELYLQST